MSLGMILIADDEPRMLEILKPSLIAQGYPVLEAQGRDDVLQKLRNSRPELILLGVGAAEISGPELCREIRVGSDVPIIVLTTRSTERDKVMALDAGADDYVVRPVGIQEVLARVRATLRRATPLKGQLQFKFGELAIDFERRHVSVRGERTHLTPKEFGILRLLVANLGKPVTHRRLLQVVWGPDYGNESECLRVLISQLRKKIELDPSRPKYICTEHSWGYRFEPYRGTNSKVPGQSVKWQRRKSNSLPPGLVSRSVSTPLVNSVPSDSILRCGHRAKVKSKKE
jgi:two-component system KDP operon response regulator KdpE